MGTVLLSLPVRCTGGAVCALALGLHLRHGVRSPGPHRLWHGGHAFMAAAMGWMLLPTGLVTAWAPMWFVGGVGGAGAALVVALLGRWDGAPVDRSWIPLILGLAATAYMSLMAAGIAVAPLTYAVAAVLACETLGWFTGVLCGSVRSAAMSPPVAVSGGRATPVLSVTAADRLLLGLLGLGMAYLFVAMQQTPMSTM